MSRVRKWVIAKVNSRVVFLSHKCQDRYNIQSALSGKYVFIVYAQHRLPCAPVSHATDLVTLYFHCNVPTRTANLEPREKASCATTKQDVEDELEIFFVAAGEWLTMYNEMRALVVTKNAELALSSTDSEVLVLRALAAASATMSGEFAPSTPGIDVC